MQTGEARSESENVYELQVERKWKSTKKRKETEELNSSGKDRQEKNKETKVEER